MSGGAVERQNHSMNLSEISSTVPLICACLFVVCVCIILEGMVPCACGNVSRLFYRVRVTVRVPILQRTFERRGGGVSIKRPLLSIIVTLLSSVKSCYGYLFNAA